MTKFRMNNAEFIDRICQRLDIAVSRYPFFMLYGIIEKEFPDKVGDPEAFTAKELKKLRSILRNIEERFVKENKEEIIKELEETESHELIEEIKKK